VLYAMSYQLRPPTRYASRFTSDDLLADFFSILFVEEGARL